MKLAKILVRELGMVADHNMPCAVCRDEPAVLDLSCGVMRPGRKCEARGWRLEQRVPWRCRVMGWHKAPRDPEFNPASFSGFSGHCARCGVRVLMDSQGGWFAAPGVND